MSAKSAKYRLAVKPSKPESEEVAREAAELAASLGLLPENYAYMAGDVAIILFDENATVEYTAVTSITSALEAAILGELAGRMPRGLPREVAVVAAAALASNILTRIRDLLRSMSEELKGELRRSVRRRRGSQVEQVLERIRSELSSEFQSTVAMLAREADEIVEVSTLLVNTGMDTPRNIVWLACAFKRGMLRSEIERRMRMIRLTGMFESAIRSLYGSISEVGVDRVGRISSEEELPRVLASELALPDELFYAKLVEKSLLVLKPRRVGVPKLIIFVDASGSMSETIEGGSVRKIDAAAALAAAALRRLGRRVEVYAFNMRVWRVDDPMKLWASGGTMFDAVLGKILSLEESGGRETKYYLIVTDGLGDVSHDLLESLRRGRVVERIKMVVIPPGECHDWCRCEEARSVSEWARAVSRW